MIQNISAPICFRERHPPIRLQAALRALIDSPGELLIRRWNWKSALFSSLLRGGLFFGVNLRAGMDAALAAMLAEFLYRAATAGFHGALTQSLRRVTPQWHGTVAAMVLLPVAGHSLEFLIHWARNTPVLGASIAASVAFTVLSTLYNLHAMRHGVLVTGAEGRSLLHDLSAIPRVTLTFLLWIPRSIVALLRLLLRLS